MAENTNDNQTQSQELEPTVEEIRIEAEKLLTQIKQYSEGYQTTKRSLDAEVQAITQKTKTLNEEQGKIANLLQQISQAQQEIETQKQAIRKNHSAIDVAAKAIQNTETVVDTNNKAIQKCKDSIEEIDKAVTQSKANADANNKAIQQSKIEVDSNTKAIRQSKANVDQLETKLKAIADTADGKVEEIENFKVALQELNKTWTNTFNKTLTEKDESLSKLQETYSQKYKELEAKIEGLLPGATGAGLAKAFMERKESIETQKKFWRNMAIIGAAGLVLFGILAIIFPPKISNGFYGFLVYILTRSSILVGIVMIEEFGRRHFNIISRLAETYAYKEVLSRSFEGYKKQMETVELESTITTTETDGTGKESKKTAPMKASSKLSDNLLDNLGTDPASIYEKEKPIHAPVIDMPELAAQSIDKAVEHLGKNKFDIGWRLFAVVLVIVIAIAATVILLVK